MNGNQVKYMKVLLLMELNMEMAHIHGRMEVNILENIKMELEKEKQNIYGRMEEFLKESLKMENLMEKEKLHIGGKRWNANIKMENRRLI